MINIVLRTSLNDRISEAAVLAIDTLTAILRGPEKPDANTRESRLAASQILRLAVDLLRRPPAPAQENTAESPPPARSNARDVRLLATETLRLVEESAPHLLHHAAQATTLPPRSTAPPVSTNATDLASLAPPGSRLPSPPTPSPTGAPDPLSLLPRLQKRRDRLQQLLARTGTG